jgi:hypothetical protein
MSLEKNRPRRYDFESNGWKRVRARGLLGETAVASRRGFQRMSERELGSAQELSALGKRLRK